MEQLLYSSVETLPYSCASGVIAEPNRCSVDGEVASTIISVTHSYMLWGTTSQMPFGIIDMI